MALLVVHHVKILKERSPSRVLLPDRVRESDHSAVLFSDQRAGRIRPWLRKSARPRCKSIRFNVTIEEGV
jgi:hypothetical protein